MDAELRMSSAYTTLLDKEGPAFSASSLTSMSSSYSVSIWSLVNATGIRQMSFFPRFAKPSIAAAVWGPCHARGPTWDCHVRRQLVLSASHPYCETRRGGVN
jgi:hypothetical protein